jgi:sulfite reductase (NADPH) flavoprotein alpha-component
MHVVLEAADENFQYVAGDSVGVYPSNCPELVEAIVQAVGRRGDELVTGADGQSRTFADALMQHCCLREVSDCLVELVARTPRHANNGLLLDGLLSGSIDASELDVLDLLQQCQSRELRPQDVIAALAPLRARLYSIASSPKAHSGQLHLTVARTESHLRGRVRKGVASTMFADRLEPGKIVPVFVQRAHNFGLPPDPAAAMIMVGPGSGIAPFRAFLHERRATSATGRNWLLFGDQHRATDFLYEEEWLTMLADGTLQRLDTAFSRDQEEKRYVQHAMEENGAELFEWLESGAYFYVCGDARRMAVDVEAALQRIAARQGGWSQDRAREYVQQLKSEGRYMRDVY